MTENLSSLFPDFDRAKNQNFTGIECPKPALMIAMTARTGSTHLCLALQSTADVGRITEPFNTRGIIQREKIRLQAADFTDYMQALFTQPAASYVFKTSWVDFAPVSSWFRGFFPELQIIYLERRDIIAQAVSLFRAEISGVWHLARRAEPSSDPGIKDKFNLDHILQIMENLMAEKRCWEHFFAETSIVPHRLVYENFVADVSRGLQFISAKTGLPVKPYLDPEIGLQQLFDSVSEEWVAQVRKHVLRLT